jgi:hypothetical protein
MKHMRFGATAENLHIDQLLSNVAINYRPAGMIADMVMPVVPVQKQSDHYAIFSRADILRIEDTARAPDTEANKITRSVSSDTYYADNYALKYPVTIEDKANADPIFIQQLLNGRVEFLMDKLMLDWENRVASLVTNTSNVGSSAAVASGWTDYDNSDPLGDIWTAIDNIHDSTGLKPNKIIFGDQAWRNARRNTAIRNLIYGNNNGGGYVNTTQLGQLLEIPNVLVGGAYKNSANEAQAESLASVWGDNVLISYCAERPSVDRPSFAYSFRWSAPGLPNMQVERHPFDTRRKSEEIEAGYYQDEKITGAEYGFLLTAVNSST